MARPDGPVGRIRQVRARRARAAMLPGSLPARSSGVPVDTDRTELYSAADLYGVGPYAESPDARAYAWSLEPGDPAAHLARVLHDHAIDEALDTWLEGKQVVGVMGGHDAARGEPGYADAAVLGHGLGAAGLVVATGGGPGAMEAGNLGCRLARRPRAALDDALAVVAQAPTFRPVDPWLDAARAVLSDLGEGHPTLGVPTWFYGHEPTNLFASAIAKYFRNALREAILLQLCEAGIVFLPGAAGTVQEVFQDACENYYADDAAAVAPMVLVGTDYWTHTAPAWPLLRSLAAGRLMQDRVHLVDTVEAAVELLTPSPAQDPDPG